MKPDVEPLRLEADTNAKAFRALVESQRRMNPGDKRARALEMTAMLMRLSEDNVRSLYPHAGDREVFLRAAARRLDRETMIRIYSWDPASGEAP